MHTSTSAFEVGEKSHPRAAYVHFLASQGARIESFIRDLNGSEEIFHTLLSSCLNRRNSGAHHAAKSALRVRCSLFHATVLVNHILGQFS